MRNYKLIGDEVELMEVKEGWASHKYRKRHFSELSVEEVVGIAHAFYVEDQPRKDIAE